MTTETVVEVLSNGLYAILKTSVPILLISLVIGLIVSIFQTVTSIQEQTLTFVPKIIGVFIGIILLGNYMLNNMSEYMEMLWSDFNRYIH